MGQKLQKMIPSAPFEHESRPSAEKVGKTMTYKTDIKSQPAPATRLDFSRRARALRPPHSNYMMTLATSFCDAESKQEKLPGVIRVYLARRLPEQKTFFWTGHSSPLETSAAHSRVLKIPQALMSS